MTKVVQEWRVTENGNLICSKDFTFDAMLKLDGDFADDAQRIQYAEAIASKLNSALESVREEASNAAPLVHDAKCERIPTGLKNDNGQDLFTICDCRVRALRALQSPAREDIDSTELRK